MTSTEGDNCYQKPPYEDMEPIPIEETNALERVTSLPLVANTWDAFSSYYATTKKTYPSVMPYLELAEKLTTGAANVALATTKPVVDRFAPTVNSYANRGLDKLEDALPMIRDQPDEIYDSTKAAVTSLVTSKIDSALAVTERYVDYYLPPIDGEQDSDDEDDEDSDDDSDASSIVSNSPDNVSPTERLRVISHKVRERAYHRAMDKVHIVRKRSGETLQKLRFTVDLIDYAKEHMDSTKERMISTVATSQQNVANVWIEIKRHSTCSAAELHLLKRARQLTEQLQRSCSDILCVVTKQAKYEYLQSQALKIKESADALVRSLADKSSIHELSASVTLSTRTQINNVSNMLGSLLKIMLDHAPLDWLAPEITFDPLEGLGMQDIEAELRMHDDNPAIDLPREVESRRKNHQCRRG